jgi:hypothetical protein
LGRCSIIFIGMQSADGLNVATVQMAGVLTLGVLTGTVVSVLARVIRGQSDNVEGGVPAGPDAEAQADKAAVSLAAGVLVSVIALLWLQYDLPDLKEIAITAFLIIDRSLGVIRLKARDRLVGCVVGGMCGLFAVLFSAGSFLLWSTFLVAGFFTFSRRIYGPPETSYFGVQVTFGFATCMVIGFGPPENLYAVFDRLIGIVVAIAIMAMLLSAMRPVFAARDSGSAPSLPSSPGSAQE